LRKADLVAEHIRSLRWMFLPNPLRSTFHLVSYGNTRLSYQKSVNPNCCAITSAYLN